MLSIIIPALNEEKYLPSLLEEIKKQNFNGDFEVIIADADSKDKTVEIAQNYGCKIVRGGLPAKGRNEGARAAKGDIFLFLDADTLRLPPNFLNEIFAEFEKRKLVAASFPISPNGEKIDKMIYGFYSFLAQIPQKFLPHAVQAILVKREIHQKIRGFDEEIKIGEDHDYARRAAKVGQFGFIKTEPILFSSRRLKKDGRLKTYLTYFLAGLHMLFLGPVKSDIFKYRFNHFQRGKNKI